MAKTLHEAKQAKNDEFYTQISDIERELSNYEQHFKGKTVLCNCDDPRVSQFFWFFAQKFKTLGLKRLIGTCYKNQDYSIFTEFQSEKAASLIYDGDEDITLPIEQKNIKVVYLEGDGDFRSPECIEYLKEADIVCTNPPFSLFREYVAQLMEYNKKFLIIGNQNAITYKEIFPLIRDNRLWLGCRNGDMSFVVPQDSEPRATRFWIDEKGIKYRSLGNICWFTNLEHRRRNEELVLIGKYSPERYPKYDNYDAIEVSKVVDIPDDYWGEMGVPITFLDKYNPNQFEIVGSFNASSLDSKASDGYVLSTDTPTISKGKEILWNGPVINKQPLYKRIVIRRRQV